jgi:hypothetical protein
MNTAETAATIKAMIESCASERGGYRKALIDLLGVQYERPFNLPTAWKKRLEQFGDVAKVEQAAALGNF